MTTGSFEKLLTSGAVPQVREIAASFLTIAAKV
jgi:hypothetical protein